MTKPMTKPLSQSKLVLNCFNPATNIEFDQIPMTTPAEVTQAVTEMRTAFPTWAGMPLRDRIRILRKFQAVLVDAVDEITAVINQDNGKSRQDALQEVFITANLLQDYCRHAPQWLASEPVARGYLLFKKCYIEHRPRGVVAVIAPWNYPFNLAMGPVLSALLAGNTVVLKPSEMTAATGKLIEALFRRVPELTPFVRVVHGDGSVGAALVSAQPDYIFLTGSGPTAKKILHAAAETLTPVVCELGGKDPMLVLGDANLKQAARWGAWAAFSNSGQACMSVERVYAVEAIYDKFVEKVVVETNALQMGYSPERTSPYHLGPLTTPEQLNIVEAHVQDALNKGAKILTGGQRRGSFFEPTILVDVDHSMTIMREETFGPVMPIMRVADEEEAIRLANQSQYGLSGSVWSKNLTRAERVAHQLQTASVVINDAFVHFGVSLLPFGGIKQSGFGRTHGQAGLMEFTQPYAYVVGGPPPALDVATVLRKPGHYHDGAALVRFLFGTSLKQKAGGVLDLAKMGAESNLLRKTAAVGVVSGATAAVLTWMNRQKE